MDAGIFSSLKVGILKLMYETQESVLKCRFPTLLTESKLMEFIYSLLTLHVIHSSALTNSIFGVKC